MESQPARQPGRFEATGKALAFSAPSGAGKTTLVRKLMEERADVAFSVSATNRPPRGTEEEGVDYHFLTTEEFRRRADRGDFLEWEEVYDGRFYGTLRTAVEAVWSRGLHVVFDVDVEGGIRLKEILGDHLKSIFVSPPSLSVLESRLRARATDQPKEIERRLAKASSEMERAEHFDVILVNDDLETACGELSKVAGGFLGPEHVEA